MPLAEVADTTMLVVTSAVIFLLVAMAAYVGYPPLLAFVLHREETDGRVLRRHLLIDIRPRTVTIFSAIAIALIAALGWVLAGSWFGGLIGLVVGCLLPGAAIRVLRNRRLARLEGQLVSGIQTLASGVRAGLNLVQSMQLIARDGPNPLRQELAHLLREYEYGLPLPEAMDNASERIGSGDFRLLFAALQTSRERGGNLGDTLDRIADSIREIQRLEGRVQALTAQGRATARWLGVMPAVVLGIYYFIDSAGVQRLFTDDLGKVLLAVMIVLNVIGFLWIRKVVSIDI